MDVVERVCGQGVPSAVLLVAVDGRTVCEAVAGDAVQWADDRTPLPEGRRVRAGLATRYDLASVSKLFTTVVVLRLVEEGLADLDRPTAAYLPGFRAGGEVTLRMLLTHTAGLPPVAELWRIEGSREERIDDLLSRPLVARPGSVHAYSCVGFIIMGLLAERVTGRRLEDLVAKIVTVPLGMTGTGYRPDAGEASRCAATEFQPETGRGMVQGVVHDEANWSLGGTAGNAGVFATGSDLLRFAEMVRCEGSVPGTGGQVLRPATVARMLEHQVAGGVATPFGQGWGFRLGDEDVMGTASHRTVGHSGFTGTSVVVDLDAGRSTVLLTNAVHPRRGRIDLQPVRRMVMDEVRARFR